MKMIERKGPDGRVYRVPDYSVPGTAEQVRREYDEHELATASPMSSSRYLYMLSEMNRKEGK